MERQMSRERFREAWNPSTIAAIGAVLVSLVTAVGAIVLQLHSIRTTEKVATKTEAVLQKQDTLKAEVREVRGKVDDVHDTTNSQYTDIKAELKSAQDALAQALAAAVVAERTRVRLADEAHKVKVAPVLPHKPEER